MRGMMEDDTHRYGPDGGISRLVDLMKEKISKENNLVESAVMITSGSNQVRGGGEEDVRRGRGEGEGEGEEY
eukprot:750795-Hanusia_phi.AAC.1